jgi:hypothetical protein
MVAYRFHNSLSLAAALVLGGATWSCGAEQSVCAPRGTGCVTEQDVVSPVKVRVGVGSQPVRAGQVYLDLSGSMKGFISDERSALPFTPLQRLLDGLLSEAFTVVGLRDIARAGFGESIRHDLPPLQTFAVRTASGKSPKRLFSETNTDVARVMAEAGRHPEALSVVITDGDQDLRSAGADGVAVGSGFLRTVLIDELKGDLVDRGFGVWLIGVMSGFDSNGCYYSVLPDEHGRVGRCLHVRRRPALLWVFCKDVVMGRKLVAYLLAELRGPQPLSATDRTGATGPEVDGLELWPGGDLALDLRLIPPERLRDRSLVRRNALGGVFRWQAGSTPSAPFFGCLGLRSEGSEPLILPLELRVKLRDDADLALSLPANVWKPVVPSSSSWTLVERQGLSQGGDAAGTHTFVLSIAHGESVRTAGRGALEIPFRFTLDLSALDKHWTRRWSSADDTSAAGIEGKTLYLWDVVEGTLRSAFANREPRICLQLNLVSQ